MGLSELSRLLRLSPHSEAAIRGFCELGASDCAALRERVLVVGCGKSGTQALTSLSKHTVLPLHHEWFGHFSVVDWRMGGLLHECARRDPQWRVCYGAVLKVHRSPLETMSSLIAGFTSCGHCDESQCRNLRRDYSSPGPRHALSFMLNWQDVFSWRVAKRFANVSLPNTSRTCALPRATRLRMALEYWVRWNELSDTLASWSFAIERASMEEIVRHACLAMHDTPASWCTQSPRSSVVFSPSRKVNSSYQQRERPLLTWSEIEEVDPESAGLARRARGLARSYGYTL